MYEIALYIEVEDFKQSTIAGRIPASIKESITGFFSGSAKLNRLRTSDTA